MIRIFILLCALAASVHAATYPTDSDPTAAEVQTLIDGAADGDIIEIAAGEHTWTSGVTISGKGVSLVGAGSGRIVAWSSTSNTIGTGTKTWTVQSGASIANGTTLRAWETATSKETAYMQGTVTSLVGTTLTMDITSTAGSGTKRPWLLATLPTTTIIHQAGMNDLINLGEDTTHKSSVSGIHFKSVFGNDGAYIDVVLATGGVPVHVHDIWIHRTNDGDSMRSLGSRGLFYEISASSNAWALSNRLLMHNPYAGTGVDSTAWSRVSEWGAADTGGDSKQYWEDCDIHGWLGWIDAGDNSIVCFRHNVFNHAGINSHGRDTGDIGLRSFEVHDNTFIFHNISTDTLDVQTWVAMRGGTAVITDNVMPDINSSEWSDKPEMTLQVLALSQTAPGFGWGYGDGGVSDWPAPRQVGRGYVTGGAGTENGWYFGDAEPIYIWNNSRTPTIGLIGAQNGADPDSVADYVQAGREYFNDGTALTGYTKFEYPHPLREAAAPEPSVRNPGRIKGRAKLLR